MLHSTWETRRRWEPSESWWCIAFYRLDGIRSVDPIAFVVQTIANGSSDRCSGGDGFRPADVSVSGDTGTLEYITHLLHIHP